MGNGKKKKKEEEETALRKQGCKFPYTMFLGRVFSTSSSLKLWFVLNVPWVECFDCWLCIQEWKFLRHVNWRPWTRSFLLHDLFVSLFVQFSLTSLSNLTLFFSPVTCSAADLNLLIHYTFQNGSTDMANRSQNEQSQLAGCFAPV